MAERLWPDEDPIGKRFGFENRFDAVTVVGVVGNTRQRGLERAVRAEVCFPYLPEPPSGMFSFNAVRYVVIRTDAEPTSLIGSIRNAVRSVDAGQPISDIRTPQEIIDQSMARRRFNTILIGVFASLALILVTAGLYGVMSFFVSQRSHEFGVRMAMGADREGVLALVMKQGAKLAAVGVAVGLVGVLATTKITDSMIVGVSPTDPLTVVGGILFLIIVGLFGSFLPALRATRVDPVLALREE
jgi:ABC-type antimicrobial peptide transport system permease subunit